MLGNRTRQEATNVELTELAIWDAPHTFIRGEDSEATQRRVREVLGDDPAHVPSDELLARLHDASSLEVEWQRVFSYGLLLPEIPDLRKQEGSDSLRSRWGVHEVARLASDLFGHHEIDEDFTATSYRAPGLREFVDVVRRAADRRERVPAGLEEQLRSFLNHVERLDRFVWRWDRIAQIRVRTPRYDTLLERLAIEYDQLLTRRPRITRCKLCGRVFVPVKQSRPERYCQANLWLSAESGRRIFPPVQLERCIPLDESERLRTRKRLEQRHRRALARYGPKHSAVVQAKRELGDFSKRNKPARTGRQPQPQAQYVQEPDQEGATDG